MPHSAEISRGSPTAFVFLINQSGSMSDPFGAGENNQRKADGVADAINRLLQNLVIRCAKADGIRDYFHVSVIGYGANVGTAFSGALSGRQLVPISEVGNSPLRIDQRIKKIPDGAGGLVDQQVRFPIWFEALASGGTPMCRAINRARSVVEQWLTQHPNCFPPIVINITDGESTDGDPTSEAADLRRTSSSDGETLLFNLHLSAQNSAPISYPSDDSALPGQLAQQLFTISSTLPRCMVDVATKEGMGVGECARGFVFNAGLVELIKFLDIALPLNTRISSVHRSQVYCAN